jgi:hypothetical protein
MKLRTQSLLGVVPLFILIGLAGAIASLLLKSFDWRRGVEEQARGMAISIAEHLAGDQWPADNPAAWQRLLVAEEKLERWEFVRGIWIWDTEANLIHQWPDLPTAGSEPPTLKPILDPDHATANNAFSVVHMDIGFEPSEVVRGGAVVWGSAGRQVGWIECELEASGWLEAIGWLDERNNQKTGVLELIVVIILLGGLIAWRFARLVRGDIQHLIDSAQKVGGGDFVPPPGMQVQELQDLSETFLVLDSLTSENRRKFQRSLIENEIFRSSAVLVEELLNAAMPDIDQTIAGSRVVSRLFDHGQGARWHGVGGDARRGWLWFGSTAGPNGIKKASQALAVTSEFESLLIQDGVPPAKALAELGPLYHLHRAFVVIWTAEGEDRELWTWSKDLPMAAQQATNSDERFLGCDLEGEMAVAINLVWQGSRSRDLDTALEELNQFLGKTNAVVTAVETIP